MVVNIAYEILQTGFLLQRKWLSNLNALLSSNIQSRGTSRICEIFFQNSVSDILSTPTHLMIALKNGNLRSIVVLILWQFSVYQNPVKLFIFSDVYQILICKQHCRIVISFILGHRISVLKYHSNKLINWISNIHILYFISTSNPFLPWIFINTPYKSINLSPNKNCYQQGFGGSPGYPQRWLTDKQVLHIIQRGYLSAKPEIISFNVLIMDSSA